MNTTIIHCSHHKVMTVYFKMVLQDMAEYLGRRFVLNPQSFSECEGGLALSEHSWLEVQKWDVRGTHIVREPRDVLVSGYFYHRHCREVWCHVRDKDGTTFQEKLLALPLEEGLRLEFRRVTLPTLWEMKNWDYFNPAFLELRYEDLIHDTDHLWKYRIADHYGFTGADREKFVQVMVHRSFENQARRKLGEVNPTHHLRQGMPGDWRNHLPRDLDRELHLQYGTLFWELGYGGG